MVLSAGGNGLIEITTSYDRREWFYRLGKENCCGHLKNVRAVSDTPVIILTDANTLCCRICAPAPQKSPHECVPA